MVHSCVQWDPAGEQLAILPFGNAFVYIWSALTKELQKIDTDFKVCSCVFTAYTSSIHITQHTSLQRPSCFHNVHVH